MSFEADVSKWVKKAGRNADKFVSEFTQDVAEEVVKRSPVDTGFFRSSWVASVNTVNTTYNGEAGGSPDFSALINAKAGNVYYISNNAPYARRLEYGYSKQAPQGMVRVTLSQADNIAQRVLRRING